MYSGFVISTLGVLCVCVIKKTGKTLLSHLVVIRGKVTSPSVDSKVQLTICPPSEH